MGGDALDVIAERGAVAVHRDRASRRPGRAAPLLHTITHLLGLLDEKYLGPPEGAPRE
ncbi:hypothetical protein [Mycolicibacterium monacense]|uniref:Uncharacterized protein n=1 Tax=Mycolicibacterium monacense TaxID=85693 RepID=A0AAD1MXU4_MYCMB|nr:hypothetical protein [Mycolicibacterium monacense]BBZ59092.1 hypothetical protein MMON_03930 [Mycolicibacterium monacense]